MSSQSVSLFDAHDIKGNESIYVVLVPWMFFSVLLATMLCLGARLRHRARAVDVGVLMGGMSAMRREMHAFRKDAATLRLLAIHAKKMRALEFAIQNVAINSFEYYELDEATGELTFRNSESLVLGALLSFRRGNGHYLPTEAYINHPTSQGRAAFRNALAEQIESLTGTTPLCRWEDQRLVIFYGSFMV